MTQPAVTAAGERPLVPAKPLSPPNNAKAYWGFGPAPRVHSRVDWRFAAEQLAQGATPEEIASLLKLQPRRIRFQVKRSPRFRRLIALYVARDTRAAASKVLGLRKTVADYLERHLHRGDPKTARFLAKALRLFEPEILETAEAINERRDLDAVLLRDRQAAYEARLSRKRVALEGQTS